MENTTENDWDNVALTLVSGRPISYTMDLYEPLYVQRPVEKLNLFSSLRPQTYGQDLLERDRLAALVDVIEVDDKQIRIRGSKDLLEKAVLASQKPDQDQCSQMSTRWRSLGDFSYSINSIAWATSGTIFVLRNHYVFWRYCPTGSAVKSATADC